jgi:hypothetical protein
MERLSEKRISYNKEISKSVRCPKPVWHNSITFIIIYSRGPQSSSNDFKFGERIEILIESRVTRMIQIKANVFVLL